MPDQPKPKLGEVTAITMTSPDLERSLKYYQKLGFSELTRFDFPFPWIQISDGALLIMLRLGNDPYCALTYYVHDLERLVTELENAGLVFSEKPNSSDLIKRYLLHSPDGLTVSLVTFVDGFKQPPGPTMLTTDQKDYFNPDKYVNKTCGMFGEFAHPVKDLDTSLEWWKKLGFSILSKFTTPYPWAIISDGLAVVGLHQTSNFTLPTITYFASDMKDKVEKLKNEGLQDFNEVGGGNITLTTPEKQRINLFKMGM